MDRIRIIVGVAGDRRKLDRLITECLDDAQCSSIVLHKTGARFEGPDGKDYVVGIDGEPRCVFPAAPPEGITSC